jgi:hypothetical protein
LGGSHVCLPPTGDVVRDRRRVRGLAAVSFPPSVRLAKQFLEEPFVRGTRARVLGDMGVAA